MHKTMLYVILILVCPSLCYSYLTSAAINGEPLVGNTAGTHKEITQYSIYNLYYRTEVKNKIMAYEGNILSGNSNEDDKFAGSAFSHFYNPIIPDAIQPGLLGLIGTGSNAKTKAESYYYQAIKYYKDDPGGAWEKVGRALHLLQDMAVPSHVHRANHFEHSVFRKNGYEWWVARYWDDTRTADGGKYQGFLLKPYITHLFLNNPYFSRPIVGGDMGGYMDAMAIQSYYGYDYDEEPIPFIGGSDRTVSDEEAKHTASILIPSVIAIGGGLLQGFCRDVDCTGPGL